MSVPVPLVPAPPEGSLQHLYALRRARWRAAYLRWIKGGRVALKVEPTFEARP